MLLSRGGDEPRTLKALYHISGAADRAAALTRQLLTFSRTNIGSPQTISLGAVVKGIEPMLSRLIEEYIEVLLVSVPGAADFIFADPVMIGQVLINLAINARDAMPDGGKLTIETSPVTISDGTDPRDMPAPRGRYISLTATDTGTGMTPEVQAKLFEPFFTTKEPGRGTGLGLATVYGIVKQSGASISVDSTPGQGTSIRILFPAVADSPWSAGLDKTSIGSRGCETILLVEDESDVRNYIRESLEEFGYSVLEAANGADALEIAESFEAPIHVLLTDMVMPGLSAAETARRFLKLRLRTPVIRMSGYPERCGDSLDESMPYVQKPFTPDTLSRVIRDALDQVHVSS